MLASTFPLDSTSLRRFAALTLAAVLVAGCGTDNGSSAAAPVKPVLVGTGPIRIGILFPSGVTGERVELTYVRDIVNALGGVAGGRPLEFVTTDYKPDTASDIAHVDLLAKAQSLIDDPTIAAVIGPGLSSDVEAVAPLFLNAEKVMISPLSTSDEILRAYGGFGFVWRTKQSDIAQSELLVSYAKKMRASTIEVITTLGIDGQTFWRWLPFFATEYGFASTSVHVNEQKDSATCDVASAAAFARDPDMVIVGAAAKAVYGCIMSKWVAYREANPSKKPRLVFADVGQDYSKYGEINPSAAEGIEGFASMASVDGTFEADFTAAIAKATGRTTMPPNSASAADAVLLLAYALEASGGATGAALDKAMRKVVDGRGKKVPFTKDGIAEGLRLLGNGEYPDVTGAGSDLTYTSGLYVDPASSTYARWVYERGRLVKKESYFTGEANFLSASKALASPKDASLATPTLTPGFTPPKAKADTWAFLATFSDGWVNYRHQADALRQYRALLDRGIPRDHIILMGANDLVNATENTLASTVRNQSGGANLYQDVTYDYPLTDFNASDFLRVLSGQVTARTPKVLQTTDASNIYVYVSGHGGPPGMPVGASTVSEGIDGTSESALLTPESLRLALCGMQTAKKYRRILFVIESCYSGVFGSPFTGGITLGCGGTGTTPGAPLFGTLLITAANTAESSFGAQFDKKLTSWVADQFSDTFASKAFEGGGIAKPAFELFKSVSTSVAGSHVSIYNEGAYGNTSAESLAEMVSP
jgi:ABC-type branched-subunit amino acid transport system substrate-binding protein